jgi:hypothetical protein
MGGAILALPICRHGVHRALRYSYCLVVFSKLSACTKDNTRACPHCVLDSKSYYCITVGASDTFLTKFYSLTL